MEITTDSLDFSLPERDPYSAYKAMITQCLGFSNNKKDTIIKEVFYPILCQYKRSLYHTQSGLLESETVGKYITIPVFRNSNINEASMTTLLDFHMKQYPDISMRDIARTTLYENPRIFDTLGIKKSSIILSYLAGNNLDELMSLFPNTDIQGIIDLGSRVLEVYSIINNRASGLQKIPIRKMHTLAHF